MSEWSKDRMPVNGPRQPLRDHDGAGPQRWRVVVPVKGGPDAKSRLRPPDGVDRHGLARALALDTVAAACATIGADRVLVVTSDLEVGAGVTRLGATTHPDPGDGLNAAIRAGWAAAGADGPVAVLLGDVPALRPAELREALTAAEAHASAFVPDAESTGTVLLAAASRPRPEPRFGPGSAAAHERDGHRRLHLALPGLRRDVDDESSLREALRLGVGPHTAALLAQLTVPHVAVPTSTGT